MKKLLFLLFSIVFVSPAFASFCREYKHENTDVWFSSAEAACRDWGDYLANEYPGLGYGYRGYEGSYCNAWSSGPYRRLQERECQKDPWCSSTDGKLTNIRIHSGWANIGTAGDVVVQGIGYVPRKGCYNSCEYTLSSTDIVPGSTSIGAPRPDGYFAVFHQYQFIGTGKGCVEGDKTTIGDGESSTPPPKEEEKEKIDKEKCEGDGGYFGQVNGKDVCLKNDDDGKCPPGETYGKINGKDVCLKTDNNDKCGPNEYFGHVNGKEVCIGSDPTVPPKPPTDNPGNGSGNGDGQGTGPGGNGNGQSSGGGGGGSGNGKGNGEGDGEGDGAGPGFGDQPGLYEPRYKNGIKGVWDQKKGQLQNSGLGRLSKRLMPAVNSGTAPKWQIDMNWGKGMNFGVINLAPPPMIWPILRVMVMVCALILARKLVFGG